MPIPALPSLDKYQYPMKVFGYCREGLQQSVLSHNISIENLVSLITKNPEEGLITALRMLPYKSARYTSIKKMLPYVTPHATFSGRRKKENVDRLSGYFYFDIDNDSLPVGVEEMKQQILERHRDKITLLGRSVGGRGLFFYVGLAHSEVLTTENFDAVHDYLRRELFSDLPTDSNASGVNRIHILPWDPELYTDVKAKVVVPDSVLRGKKLITRGINNTTTECCTGGDKFLDIKYLLKMIKFTTEVDVGDLDVLVKDVWVCKVFVPKVIRDGKKHKTYRSMVNCLMHNNPGIELLVILSYINFVNTYYTDGKPMRLQEMKRMVTTEYNRILKTGIIYGLKLKPYHSNPKHDRITRIKNVAKVRGAEQKQKSIGLITKAVEQLRAESAEKITLKKVAKLLDGQLSEGTINRYLYKDVIKPNID